MNTVLYFAMGVTAGTVVIGIAAIINAIRVNGEKHGEHFTLWPTPRHRGPTV